MDEIIYKNPEEVNDYIINTSNLLLNTLRGFTNAAGRKDNSELLVITLKSVFKEAYILGYNTCKEEVLYESIKKELKGELDNGKGEETND